MAQFCHPSLFFTGTRPLKKVFTGVYPYPRNSPVFLAALAQNVHISPKSLFPVQPLHRELRPNGWANLGHHLRQPHPLRVLVLDRLTSSLTTCPLSNRSQCAVVGVERCRSGWDGQPRALVACQPTDPQPRPPHL